MKEMLKLNFKDSFPSALGRRRSWLNLRSQLAHSPLRLGPLALRFHPLSALGSQLVREILRLRVCLLRPSVRIRCRRQAPMEVL